MRSFTSTIKAARTAGITVIGMIKSITAVSILAARITNSIPEATGAVTGEDGEVSGAAKAAEGVASERIRCRK